MRRLSFNAQECVKEAPPNSDAVGVELNQIIRKTGLSGFQILWYRHLPQEIVMRLTPCAALLLTCAPFE